MMKTSLLEVYLKRLNSVNKTMNDWLKALLLVLIWSLFD